MLGYDIKSASLLMFPFDHITGKYIFNAQIFLKMTFWLKYVDKNITTLNEKTESLKCETLFYKRFTKDLILR